LANSIADSTIPLGESPQNDITLADSDPEGDVCVVMEEVREVREIGERESSCE
jgi:hypothetical protein